MGVEIRMKLAEERHGRRARRMSAARGGHGRIVLFLRRVAALRQRAEVLGDEQQVCVSRASLSARSVASFEERQVSSGSGAHACLPPRGDTPLLLPHALK